MTKKRYNYFIPLTGLILFTLIACAQPKNITGSTVHVYYWLRLPGAIPVDPETGNEKAAMADTMLLVYAETNKPDVGWLYAWKQGRVYALTMQELTAPVNLGVEKQTGQAVQLIPQSKKIYRQLQLVATASDNIQPMPPANDPSLWLVGVYKGKRFLQKAAPPVQLEMALSQ